MEEQAYIFRSDGPGPDVPYVAGGPVDCGDMRDLSDPGRRCDTDFSGDGHELQDTDADSDDGADGFAGFGGDRDFPEDPDGDGHGNHDGHGFGFFAGPHGPDADGQGDLADEERFRANLPVPAEDPHARVPAQWRGGGRVSEVQDSLRAYLNEVSLIPMLSKEEERDLVREYTLTGSREAGQRLVTSNLRLVVKLAMQFQSSWLNNLQDLIQEGNIGLLHALKKFDPGRQVKFSYYAAYWIRAYILKHIMDNWRLVKVGTTQNQRRLFFNLRKEQDKLRKEGYDPAPELLAERLGVSVSEVSEMDARLSSGREVSLSSPIGPDMEESQVSMVADPGEGADSLLADAQIRTMVSDRLVRFKKTLGKRDREILECRLLSDDPLTLQEVGESFGISRERVRQLEERLKKKLTAYLLEELPELSLSQ
ncbi:MAG: RNA polymerase factor sigma-32 [Deltaproteobacteria bacterium]|nr:RNA polymerase factor sigma-32 [Deltaproteobacteria bacterium]